MISGKLIAGFRSIWRRSESVPWGILQPDAFHISSGSDAAGLRFTIEQAAWRFGYLVVGGWALHSRGPLTRAELIIQCGMSEIRMPLEAGLDRPDVAEATGSPYGQISGFFGWGRSCARDCTRIGLHLYFAEANQVHIELDPRSIRPENISQIFRAISESGGRRDLLLSLRRRGLSEFSRHLALFPHVPEMPARQGFSLEEPLACLNPEPDDYPPLREPVDVIIPVYNGLQHLPGLFETLFKNTTTACRFIVVEDASSDARTVLYLQRRLHRVKNVLFLRNSRNLGFAESVNRAAQHARGHFAILNTDVAVPADWLQRLLAPIVANPVIAATTPFTNAGTIYSFPITNVNNPLPEGLTTDDLDGSFRRLKPAPQKGLEPPTAVGFCMGVNGDVWREIGGFDEKTFGPGYGEENDWCQRAAARGRRTVLVPNLFVYHANGGSFSEPRRRALLERNLRLMGQRWPGYHRSVAAFIRRDPWASRRAAAVLAACLAPSARALLIVDHDLGGGANLYRERQLERARSEGRATLLLTYDRTRRTGVLNTSRGTLHACLDVPDVSAITELPRAGAPQEILYNNLVGWPTPQRVLKALLLLKRKTRAQLTLAFHDYLAVCPSYHLLDADGRFCGVPKNLATCRACLPRNRYLEPRAGTDLGAWRAVWQQACLAADRLVFFSESSRRLAARVLPLDKDKTQVRPHEPAHIFRERVSPPRGAPLTIGVVGAIGYHKGAQLVVELAELLVDHRPETRLVVIGELAVLDRPPNLTVTGPYAGRELPGLLRAHGVTLCFLPSIWPETFSYVTSELMSLQMPLVCFDLGAPAERVREYQKGCVAQSICAEAALEAIRTLETQVVSQQGARLERPTCRVSKPGEAIN